MHAGKLPPNIEVDEFFFQAGTRLGVPASQQMYISANYTHALRYVLERGVNVVGQLVAKRVRGGETRISLSCNPTSRSICLRSARAVNAISCSSDRSIRSCRSCRAMPISRPANSTCCWRDRSDFPCLRPPRDPIDLAEYAAGLHVARTVVDGGTLQLGIGSLGDAVAQALILRHKRNADFCGILARLDPADRAPTGMRESAPFDVGLHGLSEMFVEGFLDLAQRRHPQTRDGRHGDGSSVLRWLARLLPGAAGDAGGRAGEAADDRGLLRQ